MDRRNTVDMVIFHLFHCRIMHLMVGLGRCAKYYYSCLSYIFLFSTRSTITREKFEELCEDLWERSLTPVKEVLKNSGLKVDEVYAVELIGGATRVPKLQVCIAFLQFYIFAYLCIVVALTFI